MFRLPFRRRSTPRPAGGTPWFALLLAALALLAGCAEGSDLSYKINFDASPEERGHIAQAFEEWSQLTGVATWETDAATFVIDRDDSAVGVGPFRAMTYTSTNYDLDFESGKYRRSLRSARIVLKESSVDWSSEAWLFVMRHEVGHGLDLAHKPDCGSLMFSNISFPEEICPDRQMGIDADSALRAMANIENGWM